MKSKIRKKIKSKSKSKSKTWMTFAVWLKSC